MIGKFMKQSVKTSLIIACLILAFHTVTGRFSSSSNEPNERKIRATCIVEIQKNLRYPDTMEITNRSVIPTGENQWSVAIGVRSENDFGAMVPANFVCSVSRENGEYNLKSIRN